MTMTVVRIVAEVTKICKSRGSVALTKFSWGVVEWKFLTQHVGENEESMVDTEN